MERRLAAILAADVAGYSRLMEVDEEATVRTLNACRRVIEGFVTLRRIALSPLCYCCRVRAAVVPLKTLAIAASRLT